MSRENLNKNDIDLSLFLCELYNIKFRLENLIVEMERLSKESD